MKSALKVSVALALVLLSAMSAEAAQTYCEATVSERLGRLNVDPSDIRKIFYIPIYRYMVEDEELIGYEAWVSLHSCRGNLVIDMSRQCTVRQVYGRGACDLGGAVETW